MNIGEVFSAERKKNNYTQGYVADKLGLSQSYLCSLERGRRIPTINLVQLFCDFYHKPLWVMLSQIDKSLPPKGKEEQHKKLMDGINELMSEVYE